MITLQFWDGLQWQEVGIYDDEDSAWQRSAPDRLNYRTISEGGMILTDMSTELAKIQQNYSVQVLAEAANKYALEELGEQQYGKNKNAVLAITSTFIDGAKFIIEDMLLKIQMEGRINRKF